MKMNLLALAAVAAIATAPAFAAEHPAAKTETKVEAKDNGGYMEKTTTEQKDAAGTSMTSEKKTDVNVDSKGNMEATTTTEKVVDPKGLMNESKETVKDTKKVDANGKVVKKNHKHTKKVDGKTVADTEAKTEATESTTK